MKTVKVPQNLTREAAIAINDSGLSMSISSEEPYLRYDLWNDQEYYEVIDHSEGAINEHRLKAGLPLLWNHDRSQHLGTANSYKIENGRCVIGDIVWASSEFAQSKKRDVESGAIRSTSVGYRILGDGKLVGHREGIPVLRFNTEIYEGSLAPVAADITVGPGRSKEAGNEPIEVKILRNENSSLDETRENENKHVMTEVEISALQESLKTEKERAEKAELALKEANEAHEKAAKDAGEKAAKDAETKERQRSVDIHKLGGDIAKAHGFDLGAAISSHVSEGKSVEDFRHFVLTTNFKASPLPTGGEAPKGSMKRSDFEKLEPREQGAFMRGGGKLID